MKNLFKNILSINTMIWMIIMLTLVGKMQGQTSSPLAIHIDSINAECSDSCDGAVTSAVTGGLPFSKGSYKYLWNTGQTIEAINQLCPGIYSVTVTDSLGNQVSAHTTVGIQDSLVSYFILYPDTTTSHHYYVVNEATSNHHMTYLWNWGDGTHDTAAYPTHTYSAAGNYTICLTVKSGACASIYCDTSYLQRTQNSIISVQVISKTNGIKNIELSKQVKIYPNPAANIITIETGSNSEVRSENADLRVYDVVGNLVMEKSITANKTNIDVSALTSGVYFIKATTDKGEVVKKFIKQ